MASWGTRRKGGAHEHTLRILGIAGSLRHASYNRGALRAAVELVPPGATIDIFAIDGIPAYNQDEEQTLPPKVVELKRRIAQPHTVVQER